MLLCNQTDTGGGTDMVEELNIRMGAEARLDDIAYKLKHVIASKAQEIARQAGSACVERDHIAQAVEELGFGQFLS